MPGPLQRGYNNKNAIIGWDHLKIFSGTTRIGHIYVKAF
jgi:hypothetical protein